MIKGLKNFVACTSGLGGINDSVDWCSESGSYSEQTKKVATLFCDK